ncbi:MAG: diguanylate cyclase domain-containing protein [Vibrio sp.]
MPPKAKPVQHKHTRVEGFYLSAKIEFIILVIAMLLILLSFNIFNISLLNMFSSIFSHCNRLLLDKLLIFSLSFFILLGIYFFRRFKDLYRFSQEIACHAYFDEVTQLPNRALVYDYIKKRIQQHDKSKKLVIAFIDFDRFKVINDTYGHHFGDELLLQVSSRLANALHDGEMIARLGGDEFLFVSSYQKESEIPDLIERLKETRNNSFYIQSIEIRLKYSIGVALYPKNGETVDTLIRSADVAMYHAKLQGKMYCVASQSGIEECIPENVKSI